MAMLSFCEENNALGRDHVRTSALRALPAVPAPSPCPALPGLLQLNLTSCDLLATLAGVCNGSALASSSSSPACAALPTMCSQATAWAATTPAASRSSLRAYCPSDPNLPHSRSGDGANVLPSAAPAAGPSAMQGGPKPPPAVQGPGPALLAAAAGSLACLTTPSAAGCVSYMYPDANATADVVALCRSMPNMPGCSVEAACKVRRCWLGRGGEGRGRAL